VTGDVLVANRSNYQADLKKDMVQKGVRKVGTTKSLDLSEVESSFKTASKSQIPQGGQEKKTWSARPSGEGRKNKKIYATHGPAWPPSILGG